MWQLLIASPPILNDRLKAGTLVQGVICYVFPKVRKSM